MIIIIWFATVSQQILFLSVSENTFLRKFEQIISVLSQGFNPSINDKETSSISTQRMYIMNRSKIEYGRRSDLLVTFEQNDEDINSAL